MEKRINTDLLDKAIIFATEAHKGFERRGKNFPYIVHPMEAVSIVATITDDQELLSAAVLHDVVEDTDITSDTIQKLFGEKIASLVVAESDEKIEGKTEEESWKDRKKQAIDRLKNASYEAKIVAIGDKLSNMRAIYRDYIDIGDKIWDRFHTKNKKDHEWHYRGLLDSLSELSDTHAYKEFEELFSKVFN